MSDEDNGGRDDAPKKERPDGRVTERGGRPPRRERPDSEDGPPADGWHQPRSKPGSKTGSTPPRDWGKGEDRSGRDRPDRSEWGRPGGGRAGGGRSGGGRSGGRPSRGRPTGGGGWGRPGDSPQQRRGPGRPRDERRPEKPVEDPARLRAAQRLAEIDELEVAVEKLVAGGDGLGRFEGIPIFIPLSAPGDKLRVRIVDRKPGYARGEILEVLEPGPGRREPPCPFFERCGGCDLQHLEESAQLRAKSEAVVETLRRIGGVELPRRFEILAGDPWGYRLRTQLHVETTERGAEAGYYARGSHDLVPVDRCPILVPHIEAILPRLPRWLRGENPPPRLDLASGDGETFTCSPPHDKLPQGEVEITIGDFTYQYDARCFFQAHRTLTPKLVEHAMADDLIGTDPENPAGEAFDLYAGVGLFTLPLARRYSKVTAIDGDRVAIRFARRNARLAGFTAVDTEAKAVDSWIYRLPENAARVLADPPRAGLSARVRGLLLQKRPRRLTYVSCQPATLARDLKILDRAYRLEALTLLDMFPQTGHMESVAQLRLRDADS